MTDWAWWAGSSCEIFEVGPHETKDDAIQEALDQLAYDEVEKPDGTWRRGVYFAECAGEYFECEECRDPPKPCKGCNDALLPGELATQFWNVRNDGYVELPYEEDS